MPKWKHEDYYDNSMNEFPVGGKIVNAVVIAVVKTFTKLYWPYRIQGKEHIDDAASKGGFIMISNHASMVDPLVMYFAMPGNRPVRFIYKGEFDSSPIFRWLLARIGAIPVARDTADRKAIKRAVNAIKRGEVIGIFPEGTRTRTDRDDQSPPVIHGGFALIAQMAKCPILPVGIYGVEKVVPKGSKFPRRVPIDVKIGKPLFFDEFSSLERREAISAMEAKAMAEVYRLRDDLAREDQER